MPDATPHEAHRLAADIMRDSRAQWDATAAAREYDMHADAHRPMIEPDETIGEYGARCYAAGRDDARETIDHHAAALRYVAHCIGTRKWISPESQRNVVNAAAAWIERQ